MFRKESQKPRHGNKRCDEWRIEAGICGSLRPRRNKPRRGVAIAGAAAGSFALGALALGLLVIARRRRRLVPVDRLRRRGRVRRVHRLVERGIEPRLLALGISLEDRKSVVSGKSVSVRVDLGGGRILKTKKKK